MADYKKKKTKPEFDRLPPQNIEAERCVLGAMLLNPDAVGMAVEILHDQAEDIFYLEAHQHIYTAIIQLYTKNRPIDAITLTDQLKRNATLEEAQGIVYISGLLDAVPTSANVEYYAQIVMDASVLRRLITTCSIIAGSAYEGTEEVSELLDRAEADMFSIAEQRQLNAPEIISSLIPAAVERIEQQLKLGTGVTGLPSGLTDLDNLLSGFQPSDMIILAARPSVGKTAMALNTAAHAAINEKKNVLVFSLEMSKEQLTQRLLCMIGKINSARLRTGFLAKDEFPKLTTAAGKLSGAPLYIDDTPNISILDLRAKARRHKAQHGLDFLIIDYLQLMSGSRRAESRQVEISEISRQVKGLGRELKVPVLALCQLSREAEKDDSGSPKLSHLRESGAIEQDADVVLMLSRPPAHETEGNENIINLTVAKHRNGPTGNTQVLFVKETQHFGDLVRGGGGGHHHEAYAPEERLEEGYMEDDTPF